MKGYKILEHDLQCHPLTMAQCFNDKLYEKLAKQYTIPGTFEEKRYPRVGWNGMHFAPQIIYLCYGKILSYDSHVVEVEATGDCDIMSSFGSTRSGSPFRIEDAIVATNKLTIIREVPPQEVWDMMLMELDELRRNRCWTVAEIVANSIYWKTVSGYFKGVKGFTKKDFEERTGLTESRWSEYLK